MTADTNKTHEFTLLLAGLDLDDEAILEGLAEATEREALFGRRGEVQFADFATEARSFPEAAVRAIQQVDGAVSGLRVLRVEPEELVSASEIAERTGRTRQSVHQLIRGSRGPGGFPAPVTWVGARHPLWRWSEVARWHSLGDDEGSERALIAEFLSVLNAALEAREHTQRLGDLAVGEAEDVRRAYLSGVTWAVALWDTPSRPRDGDPAGVSSASAASRLPG